MAPLDRQLASGLVLAHNLGADPASVGYRQACALGPGPYCGAIDPRLAARTSATAAAIFHAPTSRDEGGECHGQPRPVRLPEVDFVAHRVEAEGDGLGTMGAVQVVGGYHGNTPRHATNIASPSAAVSLDRYPLAGYGATKAAVVALTRELAYQWDGRGVRVNALAPSFFPSATTGWLTDPDQVAWISANAPLSRPPRPEELDGPLLFLASDASSYVTGQDPVR